MDNKVEMLGVLSRSLVRGFCLISLLEGEMDPEDFAGLL
jgi:hypothetical protein